MKSILCMGLITAVWLIRQLWTWGSRLQAQVVHDPAQAIAGRLGRTLGLERSLWRNRITAWGVRGLFLAMIVLIGMPSPQALACACSEVVIGNAATQWNNLSVNNTDGGLQLSQSDIHIPGNCPFNVVRKYASSDPTWGPLGMGWTFDFIYYLMPSDGVHTYQFYKGGVIISFNSTPGGIVSEDGAYILTTLAGGGTGLAGADLKVADRHGNSWYFKLDGYLIAYLDHNGSETDYTWTQILRRTQQNAFTEVWLPLSVTYEDGRSLTFTYEDDSTPLSGYLAQITTSTGFTVSYTYSDDKLLTGVSKSNGQYIDYGYYRLDHGGANGGFIQDWLTSITYANGAEVDIFYNGNFGGDSTSPLRVVRVVGTDSSSGSGGGGEGVDETGPINYNHTYSYASATNNMTSIQTNGLGSTSSYSYNATTNGFWTNSIEVIPPATVPITTVNEVDTDALSNSVSTLNNAIGLPLQVIDKRGNSTYFVYDSTNSDPQSQLNLLSSTNRLGKVATYQYDASYNLTNSIDPLGHSNGISFDSYHRITAVRNGLNQVVKSTTYTGYGKVATQADGAGNTTTFNCDGSGYLTNTVDASGKNWKATYDTNGNKLTATNPLGKTVSYTYDGFYKVATITNALGNVTRFTRDVMADITQVQDANGNSTYTTYDLLQRPLTVTNAIGGVTQFNYNVEGKSTSCVDANANSYSYTHDSLDQTKTFVYPDSSHETYSYDPNGNLSSVTNRANQTISNTYDAENRLTTKIWKGAVRGATFVYGYDDANKPTGVNKILEGTPITNSIIGYTYNAANQVVTNTAEGRAIAYQYDNAQRVSQVAYPSGAQANYSYNSRSQLSAITNSANAQVAGYIYDDAGRLIKKTLGNGLEDDYTYDDANHVTQIVLCQTSNTNNIVQSFDYGYDNVGNRLWVKYKDGTGDVYQYDATYQVTGVKYGVTNAPAGYASASGATRTVTYAYDAVGNRTSVADSSSSTNSYTANNLNQYSAVGTTSYTYDTKGDLTGDGTFTYTYDNEGHLLTAIKTGSSGSYDYDALGRRMDKTVSNGGAVLIRYVYDGNNLIEQRDAAGNVQAKYIYESGIDHPIQAVIGSNTYYFQQDALGNVTALTDSSGNLVEQYTYDIYGKPTIKDGSGTVLTTAKTPFLFAGREYDSETGLYHYRARAYSPELGRFLQSDPIAFSGGDPNIYRYCGNNPINRNDPMGLCDGDYVDINGMLYLDIGGGVFLSTGIYTNPALNADLRGMQDMSGLLSLVTGIGALGEVGAGLGAEGLAGNATTGAVNTWWGGVEGLEAAQASGGSILTISPAAEVAAATGDYSLVVQESQTAAQVASGAQQAFLGSTGGSIFLGTELPTLLANPAVTKIVITF
jgi:RHS repeat-associated protein